MPVTPAEFVRRLYTQLEKGKGMRFSAEEMDMLAEMGAIDAVSNFAADWVRRQSEGRLAASRAEQAVRSSESVDDAMRRARSRTSRGGGK
jgi:hypothetical protein